MRNVAAGSLATRLGIEEGTRAAPLDHRVLLQVRRARRPDGHRGAHHRVRLGRPAGARRHHVARAAHQRLPLRPVPRRRHQAGRFQDASSAGCGRTTRCASCSPTRSAPDCCRLWDIETSEKLDKDRFRRDLGGVEAYQEVARRLGILPRQPDADVNGPGAGALEIEARGDDEGAHHHHLEAGVLDPQARRSRRSACARLRRCRRGAPGQIYRGRAGRDATRPRPAPRSSACASSCSPTP